MRKVLYRDEPFFFRVENRGDSIWYDKRQVVVVLRKREGLLALVRSHKVVGEGIVGNGTVRATLERVLKGIIAKENPEPPLLIDCSPEIAELYRE